MLLMLLDQEVVLMCFGMGTIGGQKSGKKKSLLSVSCQKKKYDIKCTVAIVTFLTTYDALDIGNPLGAMN